MYIQTFFNQLVGFWGLQKTDMSIENSTLIVYDHNSFYIQHSNSEKVNSRKKKNLETR